MAESKRTELVEWNGIPMIQLTKSNGQTFKFGKAKAEAIVHCLPEIIAYAKDQGIDISDVPTLTKAKAKAKK